MLCHPLAPVEKGELDQKTTPHDLAPELLNELAERLRRPTGGQQVVVDQDPRAAAQGIGVHLELPGAVLELIFGTDRLVGEPAGLARDDEPGTELEGERRAEQKAARLRRDHGIDTQWASVVGQLPDGVSERSGIGQQRGDVLEVDPLPWKVWDLANQLAQAGLAGARHRGAHQRTIFRRSRINSRCLRWVATAARFSSASTASLRRCGLRERDRKSTRLNS